jgi:hypothetical protein
MLAGALEIVQLSGTKAVYPFDMKNEEHDELWALLGKAREAKVSPFFASKVIRSIRSTAEQDLGVLAWLRRRWLLPLSAGAAAAVLAIMVINRPAREPEGVAVAADPLEEIAEVASTSPGMPSLDALLASEDHSIWLAADPSPLF